MAEYNLFGIQKVDEERIHRKALEDHAEAMYEALKWALPRTQPLRHSFGDGKWRCGCCPAMPQYKGKNDFVHYPDCVYGNAQALLAEIDEAKE